MNQQNNISKPFAYYPQNMNRTMEIVDPTYSQHIIKPPERNITYGRIPQQLVIDSADRNCQKYPNPNCYTYELEHEYKDVVSIELTQACIPYTGYIINNHNNKFQFQESFNQTLVAIVPPGDYDTSTSLATALENALNSVGESHYTVIPNTFLRKFTISSDLMGGDNIFRAVFCGCLCGNTSGCEVCRKRNCGKYLKDTIAPKIGFDKVNLLFAAGVIIRVNLIDDTNLELIACNSQFETDFDNGDTITFENNAGVTYTIVDIISDTEIVITSSVQNIMDAFNTLDGSKIFANKYISNFTWDLEDEKYIILELNHTDKGAERLESNNKNISNSFAVIPMNIEHGKNQIFVLGNFPRRGNEKFYNPPLGLIDRLSIKFLTKNGHLYDFNGRDHLLEFQIISLNSPGKYNTLLTT